MHSLLAKLLQKKGIGSTEELDAKQPPTGGPSEKEIFEHYERVLAGKELTLEDIKKFIDQQIGVIEGKWADFGTLEARKKELIAYHTVYKTILKAISAPQTERENLESYLVQQIK